MDLPKGYKKAVVLMIVLISAIVLGEISRYLPMEHRGSFVGMGLIIALFLLWFLYKIGCIELLDFFKAALRLNRRKKAKHDQSLNGGNSQ